MSKKKRNNNSCKDTKGNSYNKGIKNTDEYGYDFVAELNHFTNIDEQREKAHKLEKM